MATFRLGTAAIADVASILAWTEDHFGEIIRLRYERHFIIGLRDVASDPERLGSLARPELGLAVRSYHLRHSRERARGHDAFIRKPRHLLLYRTLIPGVIGVGRVLHDAMEIERHLPENYGDE
jgi:toxin ParE1/3/4